MVHQVGITAALPFNSMESASELLRKQPSKLPLSLSLDDALSRRTSALLQSPANDPNFLMADVEIVATYKLSNINRTKLENLIHRIFDPARLNIEIKDRFGNPITPREWFLVPVFVIDKAVERIRDGTITNYRYDPKTASLIRAAN